VTHGARVASPMPDLKPETLLAQAMGAVDPLTGAVVPGIQPSTTFLRDPDNGYRRGSDYARDRSPAFGPAEQLLAALEGGAGALLFASGMAAATAVFQALRPGDHVVAPVVIYWGLRKWLLETATTWGLEIELVDTTEVDVVRRALRPGRTRLLWLETPANPTWAVSDIAALAELAHVAGAKVAVDNTVPTPLLTRPLALGADLVMHAATKYLNGHSDVVAGALVTAADDELWARIRTIRHDQGAILGPFEAWLLTRGMRTLHLRVRAACAGAMHLAAHLQHHKRIERVLYPGLPTHKGHTLAARQMRGGFGGMLSILVQGGEEAAIATAANVSLWKRATSLGGVESLIEHRASVEGPTSPAPPNLLRLSAGAEDVGDLIADLDQALGRSG
jgi:cystathionine gamma-synthase